MRYQEIIEARSGTKAAMKRGKARRSISGAERKKASAARQYRGAIDKAGDSPSKRREASQRYQDQLRDANSAIVDAQAKLRT